MAKFPIGAWMCPSKGAAEKFVQKILNETPLDTPLGPNRFAFINALLTEYYPEKLNGGIEVIVVRMNKIPGYAPARGFWLKHVDGSETAISYKDPFRSKEQRRLADLNWCGRTAIKDITRAFKDKYFNGSPTAVCQATGQLLNWSDAVVDHAQPWPFNRILTEWIGDRTITIIHETIACRFEINDAHSFIDFHNERAVLRIISQSENNRLGLRGD